MGDPFGQGSSPVRDDGGRSIRGRNMTSEKDDDDFLSQMTRDEPEQAETPEPDDSDVETGEPETADEPEVTPTPEPAKENTTVPLASLKAEREKRQRAEAERQRLEAELAALRQQAAQPQQPTQTPDFYADPEGYVSNVVSKVQQQAEARLYAALDAQAREAFPDYDELMEGLVPVVQSNPALRQQIFSSPNPAKAAYQLAKQMKAMESMQDPVTYEQQLRARIKAELESELAAKAEAKAAAARAIPPDLAGSRSATSKGAAPVDPFTELFPK